MHSDPAYRICFICSGSIVVERPRTGLVRQLRTDPAGRDEPPDSPR